MKKTALRSATLAGAVAVGLALTACSGGADTTSAASGPAEIDFWGWAPGYAEAVDAYNASQDAVVVNYEEISPGAKGGYEKMLNAVTAGNAPCLGQVGYETLTSFAAQGALEDVSDIADANKDEFSAATWAAMSVGDAVYGAPVDQGPMALFYNTEVFDSLGIAVPTTWDEYQAAAQKIHAADPSKYISATYLNYDYAGFDWQAQAPWFGVEGESWKVSIDSAAGKKVADYWQGLVDEGLMSPAPMWDQSWYTGLGDGSIATHVGAVWIAGILKGSAPDGAGKWAVAPMPQWTAGDDVTGNVGGSGTAVLEGCDNPEAAWDFAHFMSTDADTFSALVETAGLYPAANDLLTLPVLSEGDDYFGGQNIYEVFAESSAQVAEGWVWGPNMPETVGFLDDSLSGAWAGTGTIADALATTQKKTVVGLEAQGLSVTE
ncbi:ABC transporter substrate-binding protein [Agromyces humatus]|uniref:Extracellular solute-binding protein n=1 Tax=Agromyces humatus TaxID=279573 RepID=A0ABN2K5K3_9MICO|nr:sugar ABC transporter substrate-binding protein [Agromyces humatus]